MNFWQIAFSVAGLLVAALGWYIAADQNYKKSQELEEQKEQRERRGVLRQANLLLRLSIKSLGPFFFSFTNLQLNDVTVTYDRLTNLLHDRGAATAFTDDDYSSLEAFWARLGKMIAMAQRETKKWETEGSGSQYPATDDERRYYLAQLFNDPVSALERAVYTVGDADVQADFVQLSKSAFEFLETMKERLQTRG